MTTPYSTAVTTGLQATATQHNNLRLDALPTITKGASDVLKNSDDTEKSNNQTSYTKIKEIKVNEAYSGTIRIKFDLKSATTANAYAKIYKNGVAIGTERINATMTYVTYSEDLSLALVANDLLQVYAHGIPSTYYVKNFRFYYSDQATQLGAYTLETTLLIVGTAISVTNQDP